MLNNFGNSLSSAPAVHEGDGRYSSTSYHHQNPTCDKDNQSNARLSMKEQRTLPLLPLGSTVQILRRQIPRPISQQHNPFNLLNKSLS